MNLTQDTGPRHREDCNQNCDVEAHHPTPCAHWKPDRSHVPIVARRLAAVNLTAQQFSCQHREHPWLDAYIVRLYASAVPTWYTYRPRCTNPARPAVPYPEAFGRSSWNGTNAPAMPALLQLQHLRKRFGPRVMFDDATVALNTDQKVGFIGRNGAGKSTLCKILIGQDTADSVSYTHLTLPTKRIV